MISIICTRYSWDFVIFFATQTYVNYSRTKAIHYDCNVAIIDSLPQENIPHMKNIKLLRSIAIAKCLGYLLWTAMYS